MSVIVIIIHILVCLALVGIVLLQSGKGADMGSAFGGGSSQTLFGSSGPGTFLGKATTAAAVIFMLTSFVLAFMSSNKEPSSIMEKVKAPIEEQAPVLPLTGTEGASAPVVPEGSPSPDRVDVSVDIPVSQPAGHPDGAEKNE